MTPRSHDLTLRNRPGLTAFKPMLNWEGDNRHLSFRRPARSRMWARGN